MGGGGVPRIEVSILQDFFFFVDTSEILECLLVIIKAPFEIYKDLFVNVVDHWPVKDVSGDLVHIVHLLIKGGTLSIKLHQDQCTYRSHILPT